MRGQLTVFIVIGFLFLAVMAFVYVMGSAVVEPPRVSNELELQLTTYVTTCLETVLADGISRLARQGFQLEGLNESPCNTIACSPLQQPADKRAFSLAPVLVPYVIRMNDHDVYGVVHAENTTVYPWVGFPFVSVNGDASVPNASRGMAFSQVVLPPLYSRESNISVQSQLERYVASMISLCATFDQFKAQRLNVTVENATAHVVLNQNPLLFEWNNASESVFVELSWPVHLGGVGVSLLKSSWSAQLPVRLSKLYARLQQLVWNESSVPWFVPKSSGIKVVKQAAGRDDLISLEDEFSLLYGKPLVVQFLRQNRRPAVFDLGVKEIKGLCYPASVESVKEGEQFVITVKTLFPPQGKSCASGRLPEAKRGVIAAVDPDEDAVTLCVSVAEGASIGALERIESFKYEAASPVTLRVWACDGGGCPSSPSWFGAGGLCSAQVVKLI